MTLAADFKAASRNARRGGWLPATVVLILAVAIGAVTGIEQLIELSQLQNIAPPIACSAPTPRGALLVYTSTIPAGKPRPQPGP